MRVKWRFVPRVLSIAEFIVSNESTSKLSVNRALFVKLRLCYNIGESIVIADADPCKKLEERSMRRLGASLMK